MNVKASVFIWMVATYFGLSETAHYGWNWSARSDAELVCDGITLLLFALAGVCYSIENNKPTVTVNNHLHEE